MTTFTGRITKIKGISDRRRLPRLGKIRLGYKVPNKGADPKKCDCKGIGCFKCTHPMEVDYFVCPPEVQKIYGDKPKELEIMVPLNDLGEIFPTAYKYYGSSKGLKCQGDGEIAYKVNETTRDFEQIKCPCDLLEKKKCNKKGILMAMLPKVSVGGIYQIGTSSGNSIEDINSGLTYVEGLVGRFALVPLKLRRVKTETHHDGKKQDHFTLQIIFDVDIATMNALRADTVRVLEHPRYQLPAPLEENPELDAVDSNIIDVQDEETGTAGIEKSEYPEFDKKTTPQDAPQSEIPLDKGSPIKKDYTKLTALDGYDRGTVVECPDRPRDKRFISKQLCNDCHKTYGCIAWPEENRD